MPPKKLRGDPYLIGIQMEGKTKTKQKQPPLFLHYHVPAQDINVVIANSPSQKLKKKIEKP